MLSATGKEYEGRGWHVSRSFVISQVRWKSKNLSDLSYTDKRPHLLFSLSAGMAAKSIFSFTFLTEFSRCFLLLPIQLENTAPSPTATHVGQ